MGPEGNKSVVQEFYDQWNSGLSTSTAWSTQTW